MDKVILGIGLLIVFALFIGFCFLCHNLFIQIIEPYMNIAVIVLSAVPVYFILRFVLGYLGIYLPCIKIPGDKYSQYIFASMAGLFTVIVFPITVVFSWLAIGVIWTLISLLFKLPSIVTLSLGGLGIGSNLSEEERKRAEQFFKRMCVRK